MNVRPWGQAGVVLPGGRLWRPLAGSWPTVGRPFAAGIDRVRTGPAGHPRRAFPAAAGATDRDLARLGRLGNPVEVLREARLIAVSRAGHP